MQALRKPDPIPQSSLIILVPTKPINSLFGLASTPLAVLSGSDQNLVKISTLLSEPPHNCNCKEFSHVIQKWYRRLHRISK